MIADSPLRGLADRFRGMARDFRPLDVELAHRCELYAHAFEEGNLNPHLRGYPPVPKPRPREVSWREAFDLLRAGKRVQCTLWTDGHLMLDEHGDFWIVDSQDCGEDPVRWIPILKDFDSWWIEVTP